jgi:hypothetical protein
MFSRLARILILVSLSAVAAVAVGPEAGRSGDAATFNLSIKRTGNGTVVSTPAGIRCGTTFTQCVASFGAGGTIHLTATPDSGWTFGGWGPPCSHTNAGLCEVPLNQNTQVTATFVTGKVEFAQAAFQASWKQSVLTGSLVVSGNASAATQLTFTLIPPDKKNKVFTTSVQAGDFTATVKLPKTGFLPGQYQLHITGVINGGPVAPKDFALTLAAPKEGVVGKAWVSSLASNSPVTQLPRGTVGVKAHFVFSSNPAAGSKVTTTWFQGSKVLGVVGKPRTKVIVSVIKLPGGLPKGFYKCVLKARGVTVKQVGVAIA